MKKIFCFFFGLVFLGLSATFAQVTMTLQQKKIASNTMYTILRQYLKTSKLQKPGTPGISEEKKEAFLAIFEDNAKVWDDITPDDFPNSTLNNSEKSVDDLISDYEKYFPEGVTIKNLNSTINFKNLPGKTAQIAIQRNISGKYIGQYYITNQRVVLELELKFSDDYTTAKISGIKKIISNPIPCPNCPKPAIEVAAIKPVKVKPKGEPLEKPGVTLSFNLSGSANAATIENPDLSKMNYDNLIKNKNSITGFSSKGGIAISGGMDMNVMFGKTKKIGIGTGLFFNHSQAKLNYDTIHQEYRGQNQGDLPDFFRIYTAYNVSENISMNNIGINLLFKYNGSTDKIGFYIDCGPVYILSSTVSSKYNTTSDYEAIYQHDGNGYFFDPAVDIDRNDWIITRKAFKASNADNQTEAEYFKSLEGFNVAIDKKDNAQSEKFKFKQAFGGLLRAGASIPISEKLNLLAGISFVYLKISDNSNYNKPLTEKMGTYNSTLYSLNGITNFNYGINIGLVVKLFKTEKK